MPNNTKGRFSTSEKSKNFWKTWDSAVNTSERQTNGRIVMAGGRGINFDRKLSIGCSLSKINYEERYRRYSN